MNFIRVSFLTVFFPTFLALAGVQAQAESRAQQTFALCTHCHGNQGEGRQDLAAPAIAGLPEWYVKRQLQKYYEGVRGTHPKDLAGMRMTPMSRTLYPKNGDFDIVAKYVAALPRPIVPDTVQGRVVKGEQTYQTCVPCHGEKAQGNEAVGAPPLAGGSDWYFLTQLHNFKGGIRAGNPARDPTGAAMIGIAAGLTPESMKDVLSYINLFKQKQ